MNNIQAQLALNEGKRVYHPSSWSPNAIKNYGRYLYRDGDRIVGENGNVYNDNLRRVIPDGWEVWENPIEDFIECLRQLEGLSL